jgi:hypothetical protein
MVDETLRPLSAGQESLWLLHRLAPDSPAYSILTAVRIRGPLDERLLDRAVRTVAERHPPLRSRYFEQDGHPYRADLGSDAVRLAVREAGSLPEDRLRAAVTEEYQRPFRLETQAPMRVTLLRATPRDAVLVLVIQHVAGDASSQWLVLRELLDVYGNLAETGFPGAEPRRASFDEHVDTERALPDSQRGERMARYWQQVRAGAAPAELPTDRPRPALRSLRGAAAAVPLPEGTGARVRCVAEDLGVTPFAFLLGVFQVMAHRYGGYGDALIGCAASARTPKTARTVGYIVNLLSLRSSISRRTTFREAARAAHLQVLSGLANVAYPTVLLTREEAGRPRGPLTHLAFTLIVTDRLEPRLAFPPAGELVGPETQYRGLRLALLDLPHMEGQFDLNAEVRLSGDTLAAVFRYDTDLFDPPTAEGIAGSYARLLAAALDDVDLAAAKAPLADPAQLLAALALGSGSPA